MKVLLTGFAPFGGETLNPSWEAVKAVKAPAGMELHKLEVPVSFRASGELVCRIMDTLSPDAVLCVGQAGGRREVTPERVALNVDDASLPDNNGDRPRPLWTGGLLFRPAGKIHGATYSESGGTCRPFQQCRHLCVQPPYVHRTAPWCPSYPKDTGRVYPRAIHPGTGSGKRRSQSAAFPAGDCVGSRSLRPDGNAL